MSDDTKALVPHEQPTSSFGLAMRPRTFNEAMEFCNRLARSSVVPKSFQQDPMAIMVCLEAGERLGYGMLQSLQNIAVINGKPSIYGDELLARVRRSPVFESIHEDVTLERAICTVRRKGEEPVTVVFSQEDAKKAKLWGKAGPWTDYPKRMLQMRARGFALRDVFPDILQGMIAAEEAEDHPQVMDPRGQPTSRPTGVIVDVPPASSVASEDRTALDDVLRAINAARSEAELTQVKAAAVALPEAQQAEARQFYKAKLLELRDTQARMVQEMQREFLDEPTAEEP